MENHVASELMPTDEAEMAKLVHQSEELAKPTAGGGGPGGESDASVVEILRVTTGKGVKLAVPYQSLDEVLSKHSVIPIPGTPAAVLGVANYDGRLLTVLDLAGILGMPTSPDTIEGIVVVSSQDLQCGLGVTQIVNGSTIRSSDISPAPHTGLIGEFVTGVIDDDTALIDVAALIRSDAILVDQTA
jgi:chemotaxis signal transduction protein